MLDFATGAGNDAFAIEQTTVAGGFRFDDGTATPEAARPTDEKAAEAPRREVVAPTPEETEHAGFQREDDAFFRTRAIGHLAQGATLWVAIGAMAATAAGGAAATRAAETTAAAAILAGVGVYAVLSVIATLISRRALEKKIDSIRRVARIGCERIRVDDPALMRGAVRDVLAEWMHICFFARDLRDANAYAIAGAALQTIVTIAAVGVAFQLSSWPPVQTSLLAAGALALTAAHLGLTLARLRRETVEPTTTEHDPTEALSARLAALLEEVRDLRNPARRRLI